MHGVGGSVEERRARRRDRARRVAATAVLAGAVVITAATSYEDAMLVEELAGAPFLLTPDAPVVTVPVTFAATAEAFEGAPQVSFQVSRTAVWEAVEDTAEPIEVRLEPHDPEEVAIRIEGSSCHPADCAARCVGSACVGSYDLVFRWPEHLVEGSARVEWSAEGTFRWPHGGFFSSPAGPAEGAELSFEFGELSGGATPPTPVAAWVTEVTPDVAVVEEEVTVETSGPLNGGVLALESVFEADVLRAALPHGWEAGEPPSYLATAASVPIPVPEHCHDGPCTFTFATLAQMVRPDMVVAHRWTDRTVDWAITATTPLAVEVVSTRASIPEVATRASLGRIVLEGADATDTIRFVVVLPAATLPSDEWPPDLADHAPVEVTPNRPAHEVPAAGAGPIVMLELRPDIDPATDEIDPHPDIEFQLVAGRASHPDADALATAWSERATQPSQWGPWRTSLHNDCLPDRACEIEVELQARTRDREPPDSDRVVALDLDAEVAVLLPWSQPVPSETPTIRLATETP